jgi:hypothetical protein
VKRRLQRWLPDPDKIRSAGWARWMGRGIQHPRLWHLGRRGTALGVAIGIFFGLLLPFGQIPLAGFTAILLRGNVPVAMASTFISNPLTLPAIFYLAYLIGVLLMGGEATSSTNAGAWPDPLLIESRLADTGEQGLLAVTLAYLDAMGMPLLLGLAVNAVLGGVIAHALVTLAWRASARQAWRRRLRERSAGPAGDGAHAEPDRDVSTAALEEPGCADSKNSAAAVPQVPLR